MTDHNVHVAIKADAKELDRAAEQAGGAFQKMDRAAAKSNQAFKESEAAAARVGTALGHMALAVTATLGAAIAVTKASIDLASSYDDLAQRTGVSTKELSAFDVQARLTGTSMNTVLGGVKNLSKNMLEASTNTGDGAKLFRALSVDLKGADGSLRPVNDVLGDLADRFSRMNDGAIKTALAVKVFGAAGEELIPFLNKGREGLADMAQEAERLGVIVSEKVAKQANEFNNQVARLQLTMRAFGLEIAETALPWLNKMVTQLLEGSRIAGGFGAALRLFGTMSPFGSPAENIDATRKRIKDLNEQEARAIEQKRDGAASGFARAAAEEKKRLEFLKLMQRLDIPTGDESTFDARDYARQNRGRIATESLTDLLTNPKKPARTKVDRFDAMREEGRSLEMQMRIEDEARELGAKYQLKWDAERLKTEEAQRRADEKYWKEYYENVTDAANDYYRAIAAGNRKQQDSYRDLKDAVEGWGRTFSRTMGEAIITGNFTARSIGQAFQNLAIEIASKQIQKRITDPLVSLGTSFLDSIFGGSSSLVPATERPTINMLNTENPLLQGIHSLSAMGNVLTPHGVMQLPAYGNGTIVRRPHVALIGEGDMNEAVVPLPDGRSIPVAMQGAGQSIVVRIENSGAPKQVSQAVPTMTPEGMVIQLITTDMMTGGPISQTMERTFGLGRSAA